MDNLFVTNLPQVWFPWSSEGMRWQHYSSVDSHQMAGNHPDPSSQPQQRTGASLLVETLPSVSDCTVHIAPRWLCPLRQWTLMSPCSAHIGWTSRSFQSKEWQCSPSAGGFSCRPLSPCGQARPAGPWPCPAGISSCCFHLPTPHFSHHQTLPLHCLHMCCWCPLPGFLTLSLHLPHCQHHLSDPVSAQGTVSGAA